MPIEVEHSEEASTTKSEHDMDDDTTEDISKSEALPFVLTPEHLAKLYVFALIWGMGAFLENEDRLKYDLFMKENLSDLDLPINMDKNPDVSFFLNE